MKCVLGCLMCIFSLFIFAQQSVTLFENVVFYDMYDDPVIDSTTPSTVHRFSNTLVAYPVSKMNLGQVTDSVKLQVTITARCDNYDRLAHVFLVLAPKKSSCYNPDSVSRIELARFITPFMNKNVKPDQVTFHFSANELSAIMKHSNVSNKYRFWIELAVFGVPYAAQKQVKGCEGRKDVFEAKMELVTFENQTKKAPKMNLIPVISNYLINNYQIEATDSIGKTCKTFSFETKKALKKATVYLISSNHGANEGGEEYIRRWHFVSLDGKDIFSYKPGGKSCEPYRFRNTQKNGIYEFEEKSEEEWTSWNNWCPGDEVPIRKIELQNVTKGKHCITISVPDAQFVDKQGYFPISMYILGIKN